jgi:hypothetical protein
MPKYIVFQVDATGACDGATPFTLPTTLAAPDADTGQQAVPVNAATGNLGLLSQADPTFRHLVGTGGFWIRGLQLSTGNVAVTRFLVGLTQPKPSLGPPTIFQTAPIFAGPANANVTNQPLIRRGVYVPAGWRIAFRADDGNPLAGGVVVGPYNISLEFETLPATKDAARAIRTTDYQRLPIAIDTT